MTTNTATKVADSMTAWRALNSGCERKQSAPVQSNLQVHKVEYTGVGGKLTCRRQWLRCRREIRKSILTPFANIVAVVSPHPLLTQYLES